MAAESKRRLRRALAASAVAHLVVVGLLAMRPVPAPMVLPPAISIDLVARVPSGGPAPPRAAPKPAPAAAKPAPAESVPAPPPPKQAKLLPKQAPDVTAKPAPKPASSGIQRRPRPQEMELGDAMAALRNELGESVPAPMEAESSGTDAATSELANAGESDGASRGGVQVSPEMMRWITMTKQHVRERWVNPPEFLGRGYVTELGVQLRADGTVVGRPEVRRSSGDPYADDNAVRAIMKASPLPAPPSAGLHVFLFVPEATQ